MRRSVRCGCGGAWRSAEVRRRAWRQRSARRKEEEVRERLAARRRRSTEHWWGREVTPCGRAGGGGIGVVAWLDPGARPRRTAQDRGVYGSLLCFFRL
jgi:hypothetical protein